MVAHILGLPEHPLIILITLSLFGTVFFFVLAGLSHLVFFRLGKQRFHPADQPKKGEIKRAVWWSLYSIGGNAVLMLPFHVLIASGHSRVYFDVDDYGWPWLLVSVGLILILSETGTYWAHRALHTKFLYRWLHKPHHSFKVPTPWVGVAFNPLDSFLQALPHHLCVFIFPVHYLVYTLFVAFLQVWAVSIHDRLSFVTWRGINYTDHHTLHHWFFRYNFGQFFTFWDRWAGTYKNPEEVRGKVPDWVLGPHRGRALLGGNVRTQVPPAEKPASLSQSPAKASS